MSIVKLNNNAVKNATSFGSVGSGAITFIKKLTASSSSTLSFVDGSSSVVLDNTYKEYIFTFNNMHPATDNVDLLFNGSDDTSSHSYDITKTTTLFRAYHYENDSGAGIGYRTTQDIAQGTGFQDLTDDIGNDNDTAACGYLHLFNPSSTTFVKHFISETILPYRDELAWHGFIGGYFNTTAAITAIQFKMSSGNIDAGDICLYGIN